ncbi:MAG: hypothetical protein BGO67_00655 [Alphaproteobacteria bacterium 41-28]|nr:MAG: hypothetical protein BGO67_00655 [Alphaproteobacteria bacterium 41-28]
MTGARLGILGLSATNGAKDAISVFSKVKSKLLQQSANGNTSTHLKKISKTYILKENYSKTSSQQENPLIKTLLKEWNLNHD